MSFILLQEIIETIKLFLDVLLKILYIMKNLKFNKIFAQEVNDSLKISFPISGFYKQGMVTATTGLGLIILGGLQAIVLIYALFASKSILKVFLLPYLFVLFPVIVIGIWIFIYGFFSKSYLLIDSEKIIIVDYIIFSDDPKVNISIPKQELKALKYMKRFIAKNLYFQAINDRTFAYDLIIETETKEYSLSKQTSFNLDETEMNWLVDEISNRLNFPINIVHEEFEWVSNQEESLD